MTTDIRRLRPALFTLMVAWAGYTGLASTGYFYGVLPRYRAETAWFVLAGLVALLAQLPSRRGDGPKPLDRFPPRQLIFVLIAFVALSFVLYAAACSLGLLSDDFVLLSMARRWHFWGDWQFFRPLPLVIWATLDRLTSSPGGVLHGLNVLLHGVNATLVAVLACRLGLRRAAAAAAGLLFITFPGSVEPVAWASGIQDVLLTTLCLGFVLAYSADGRAAVIALACLVLALCTKEAAVVAPPLALLLSSRPHAGRSRVAIALSAVAVAVAYASFRLAISGGTFAVRPSRYLLKELLSRPFATLAVPFTGSELQRFPGLGAALAWLLIGAIILAARRWRDDPASIRTVGRCAAWIALSAAPVYSMFFVSSDLQGSRYVYLGMCAWSILLCTMWLAARDDHRSVRRIGAIAVGVLVLLSLTGLRAHLDNWQTAAQLRDRVLTSAIESIRGTPCVAVHFTNVPDSIGGAYVFRNGFAEALSETGYGSRVAAAAGPRECTLSWDGSSFQSGASRLAAPVSAR